DSSEHRAISHDSATIVERREEQMKPIKMFGLAGLAALMAMAFVGVSSAMAESTALCKEDQAASECPSEKRVTHIHEVSVGKAKLLTTLITVECNVTFLGETKNANKETKSLGEPLRIEGKFTYTNCGGCEATEENGPSVINVLREGHETASVTGEGLVHVECAGTLNCNYTGVGLKGTAKGPLLSTAANGEVSLQKQ